MTPDFLWRPRIAKGGSSEGKRVSEVRAALPPDVRRLPAILVNLPVPAPQSDAIREPTVLWWLEYIAAHREGLQSSLAKPKTRYNAIRILTALAKAGGTNHINTVLDSLLAHGITHEQAVVLLAVLAGPEPGRLNLLTDYLQDRPMEH
jgi:hypothetical protein